MKRPEPVTLFLSYARKDEQMCRELEKHLNLLHQQGLISSWHDRQIRPGADWAKAINAQLETASLILLLISVDFLNSNYCHGIEMKRALERHKAGSARVIPIILRCVDWEGLPFSMLQVLPKNATPVTQWQDRDEAYLDIIRGIREVIKELPPLRDSNTLTVLNRDEEALAACDQTIRLNPNDAFACYVKGLLLDDLNRDNEALAAYDEAIHLNPDDANVWWNKGLLLDDLNRHSEALAAYDEAIRLNHNDANARWNKGLLPGNIKELAVRDKLPISPPAVSKFSRWIYISLISIIVFTLVLGGVFMLPFIQGKPSPDLFPLLCNGNFRSMNASIVNMPATSTTPSGEPIGLSEGTTIFDLHRPNKQEVQYKLQAAQDTMNNSQDVVSSLNNALRSDRTDAEAQIYLENWQVLASNHPHITIVVGVSFGHYSEKSSVDYNGASRDALQGAFTAQKECNSQNEQDVTKTQIVLMIANVGGNGNDVSAKFVANQIAEQASKDSTVVGIMGWLFSADSINVNLQLKIRGSLLPMISSASASDELQGMANFFRVCLTNSEQAQIAANFALNTMHKKRIAILYDQGTSYGNNLKDDFTRNIPNNTVEPASFKGNENDSKTLLQGALNKVLVQNPDAIFFAGYEDDLFNLLGDIASTPYASVLIVGAAALATTNDYKSLPRGLDQIYFPASATPNEWDGTNQKPPFFQDYKEIFGTLTAPTGLPSIDDDLMVSYDAMLTLLYGSQQVLSMKNTINGSDLIQALNQITVAHPIQGVTGRIAFDGSGNRDRSKTLFIEHIQGNNLKVDYREGCLRVTDTCTNN